MRWFAGDEHGLCLPFGFDGGGAGEQKGEGGSEEEGEGFIGGASEAKGRAIRHRESGCVEAVCTTTVAGGLEARVHNGSIKS